MQPSVSVQCDLCFVEVIEGETGDLERQVCESDLVDRLTTSGVALQSIEINAAGCFVIVKREDIGRLKIVTRAFNVAIRIHGVCGCISMRRDTNSDALLPSLSSVLSALHRGSISIVQILSNAAELAVVVEARQIPAAIAIMNLSL